MWIGEPPESDVREKLTFCEDCKNFVCKYYDFGICNEYGGIIKKQDFCSRGVRRAVLQMAKIDTLDLFIKIRGTRSLKRATKAINKMTKAMERLSNSANKATATFLEMKKNIPTLLECEVEEK